MKTARQLSEETLHACNGDYGRAIAELKYQLDPEGSAINEVILDEIEDLKKIRRKLHYGQ